MIITVTLNPSLDLTYDLAESTLGAVDVHRAKTSSIEASGKGVNVSRTLRRADVATVAVLPLGGRTGGHLGELLADEQVRHVSVPVPGETRINTSLLLAAGDTVKVNGPGAPLARRDLDRVLDAVGTLLADRGDEVGQDQVGERWVAVCGSLPPGLDSNVVAEFVSLAHRHAARCAVDVSGPPLAAALGATADLLAPNRLELSELVGADVAAGGVRAVADAAARLAADSRTTLLVSMGGEGAIHADGARVLHGTAPALVPVNTAGAGDAFLAGWLAVPGEPEERMARAMAWGRSTCLSVNTVDDAPGTRGVEGIAVTVMSPSGRKV